MSVQKWSCNGALLRSALASGCVLDGLSRPLLRRLLQGKGQSSAQLLALLWALAITTTFPVLHSFFVRLPMLDFVMMSPIPKAFSTNHIFSVEDSQRRVKA